MVKIIHRPDPPPDIDSFRAVRTSATVLNREAHAQLFERALVKAQAQKQSTVPVEAVNVGQLEQRESDIDRVLAVRAKEVLLALRESALSSEESIELVASDDVEIDDAMEESGDAIAGASAPTLLQLFDTQPDYIVGAASEQGVDAGGAGQEPTLDGSSAASTAVAPSFSNAPSLENRLSSVSGLLELVDLLDTASPVPGDDQWTLIMDDDGPLSALTLASDADGRWRIGVMTAFDTADVDAGMIADLRNQLESAGIGIADVALVDSALPDRSDD